MDYKFTNEEIKDAARVARIYCPGFSENEFESLMELQHHFTDSGYVEAVLGLIRLEEEKGVSCVEALDAFEKLIKEKTTLEKEIPDLEKRLENLESQIKQAASEYEKVKRDAQDAARELAEVRAEYAIAEKKLETVYKKAEKEKQQIAKDVEDCYRQAGITKEEVVTAGRIKAEVESYGFTLELAMDLAKEFSGQKNASEKLSQGLKEHGSLNKYLDELEVWGNKERSRILAEISGLESEKKNLSSESGNLKNILSQLQANTAEEQNLRRFFRRYANVSVLMDALASWNQVLFIRCTNPAFVITGAFSAKSGNAHFWTDQAPSMCPQCGYRTLSPDEGIYRALNWPAGAPGKLILGE